MKSSRCRDGLGRARGRDVGPHVYTTARCSSSSRIDYRGYMALFRQAVFRQALFRQALPLPILYRNAVLCLTLSQCRNRFLSAFLLGNGQTYATRGVPYYRVSRIFMSRIFHPCSMVPHFHVPQFHVSHFQRPLRERYVLPSKFVGPLVLLW